MKSTKSNYIYFKSSGVLSSQQHLRGLSRFLGKKFIIEDRNLKVSILLHLNKCTYFYLGEIFAGPPFT